MAARRIVLNDGWVDLEAAEVHRAGRSTPLTDMEAAVLALLAERAGEPVGRDEIHVRVFGYRSGVATRAADDTVKRLRKKIEAAPGTPTHLRTVRGVGYRFVAPGTEADVAPGVVGRHAEVRAVLEQLQRPGAAVVLTGLGGIGKTTLARAVAHRWTGPCTWVALPAADDLDAVVSALARALGAQVHHRTPTSAAAALGRMAAREPGTLLVLDEAEPCAEATADLLGLWHDTQPDLRLLITSRVPLTLPTATSMPVSALGEGHAIELLRRRGASGLPDTLRATARQHGGHPLTLELVAARGPDADMSVALGSVIRWTWDRLEVVPRRVLQAAALFAEGAALELLEETVEDGAALARAVRRLREHALLSVTRDGRYAVAQAVRAELPHAAPDLVARFVRVHLDLAEGVGPLLMDDPEAAWARLRVHHADLRRSIELAVPADPRVAVRLALAIEGPDQQWSTGSARLALWTRIDGLLPVGDEVLDDRAALAISLNRKLWAGVRDDPGVRAGIARRAKARGDATLEALALEAACVDARATDKPTLLAWADDLADRPGVDRLSRARALAAAAGVLRLLGRLHEGAERWERAASFVGGAGPLRALGLHRALCLVDLGDPTAGCALLEETDAQLAALDMPFSRAVVGSAWAWAVAQRDPRAAMDRFERAGEALGDLDPNSFLRVRHAHWRAATRHDLGEPVEIDATWAQRRESHTLSGAAAILAAQGRHDEALAWLGSARPAIAALQLPGALAWIDRGEALLRGEPPAPVAPDTDPALAAVVALAAADPAARADAEAFARRSVWVRAWARALGA